MGKFRKIQNSFLGGQVSRTAVGRTDLPQYQHSCELMQNVIPMLSGGVYRRPGTLAQQTLWASGTNATYQDGPPRLIEFIVSSTEAYVIALRNSRLTSIGGSQPGGCYVSAYRATANGNASVSSFSSATSGATFPYLMMTRGAGSQPSGTQSWPNVVGGPDDDVWLVQHAQSNDIMWLTHPAYKPQVIKRSALDTFSAGDFDANLTGLALAQAYPYLNQNATTTTMTISNASVGTGRTLTASSPFFNSGHIGAIFAIQSGTLRASGGIGFAQVTACTGTVGSPSATCTVSVIVAFSDTSAHPTWWESAWSNYRGWPRSTCMFQQRLCMAGAVPIGGESVDPLGIPCGQPDSIWCSETGDPSKFSALGDGATVGITGTLANGKNFTTPGDFVYYPIDDAQGDGQSTGPIGAQPFRITLADSQLDSIQWMSPDQEILIGTLSEEWIVAPQNGSFDVANSIATIQSHYGSDFIPAVRIGYELMFTLSGKDECRAYQYNYIDASFFAEPVQLFFDEYPKAEQGTVITGRRKFRQMKWDVTRSTLWCLDTAGNFFGMTRDRKLQVTMWHTHQFGGFNTSQGVNASTTVNLPSGMTYTDPAYQVCDGSVVSFCVTPNPQSGINDIWLVVKRTVDGVTTWQIERMIGKNTVRQSAYESTAPGNAMEPLQVDAAQILTDNGSPTNFGYTPGAYLDGYTLSGTYYSAAWGMFSISSSAAVASGACSLTSSLPPDYGNLSQPHTIVVGLPYTCIISPVRPDIPSQVGTSQGAIKRTAKCFLRFYKTLMANCGSPPSNSPSPITVVPWDVPASMGQSPEIFTGDKQVFIASQYDRDGYIYITQTSPFPFTLISVVQEGAEYDQ